MRTFKQFISEAPIRLSTYKSDHDGFMKSYHEGTIQHPFNPRVRLRGHAAIELSRFGSGVHVSDILSLTPRSGAGSEAVSFLKGLADKHDVVISGISKTYSKSPQHIQSQAKLNSFYAKRGFEVVPGGNQESDITYHPKRKS